MADPPERSASEPAPPGSKPDAAREAPAGLPWKRILELGRGALLLAMALAGTITFFKYISKSYAIGDWLAWPLLAVWGYALLFWLGNASFGLFALKRLIKHEEASSLEALALALPLGLLGFNVAMYVGGALALYRPWFGVGLPIVMAITGARELLSLARTWHTREDVEPRTALGSILSGGATVFGVIGIVFLYLQAMTPEAINFDASWSHLSIAQDYAREGRMVAFNADYTRCFPHLASIAHTYAFLAPLPHVALHWMLALHDELGAVLATLVGVGALVEALVGRRVRAGWAAFFLFPGIFVYDLNIGGAADHYEALFTAPIVIAGFHALGTTSVRRHVLVGLLAAGALSTKLHAIYVVAPIALLLLLGWIRIGVGQIRASRNWRMASQSIAMPALALGVATILGMSPHLIRNTIFHGNPVYPFALDVFKGSHPIVPRAGFLFEYLFKDWAWRPHGTFYENVKDALKLFFTFSFTPHYSFTHDVPELGSLFTLTLPWIFVVRGKKPIALAAFVGFATIFMWGMTFRVDRHLTPFFPLLAATTAALIVRGFELGLVARVGVAILVGAQLAYSGDVLSYSGYGRISDALNLIRSGYDGHAKTRFDTYRKVFRDMGASLPKEALIVEHTYRPNLGIDRRIYMDWAGQQGLISYDAVRNPRDIYDLYAKLGVTHIIDMPDERQSPSKQEDAIFTTFLHRYAKTSKRFGSYDLVEMPKIPPPPDHPWRALSMGLNGYEDGIYAIEKMNTPDALPAPVRVYPAPDEPIDRSDGGMTRMLGDVDVVFVQGHIDDVTTHKIDSHFERIASYARGYTIYAKK